MRDRAVQRAAPFVHFELLGAGVRAIDRMQLSDWSRPREIAQFTLGRHVLLSRRTGINTLSRGAVSDQQVSL